MGAAGAGGEGRDADLADDGRDAGSSRRPKTTEESRNIAAWPESMAVLISSQSELVMPGGAYWASLAYMSTAAFASGLPIAGL